MSEPEVHASPSSSEPPPYQANDADLPDCFFTKPETQQLDSVEPSECAPADRLTPYGPRQLAGESREQYWRRLSIEARLDPEYAELLDAPIKEPNARRSREPEENPEWGNFGIRGRVAQLLFARGLKRKAVRFANCGRLGRPGFCSRYPSEHKFFCKHGCEVIFCRECGDETRRNLFLDYLSVLTSVLCEHGVPTGWVLARINFTLRSNGTPITPERVKKFNAAVRIAMRKSVRSRNGYGMLFVDEVGFETRGHTAKRTAGGLNLHCHGLYFGPWIDWERTRDLWQSETTKAFGVPSSGFFIKRVRIIRGDLDRAVRWALNHMLKYTSKPPAVSAERLADLICAFNTTHRVHALGLFYGRKPRRAKKDCACPKCRTEGIASVVCFEGRLLPDGGCIPRIAPIDELLSQGYCDLREAGRAAIFAYGEPKESIWSESPPCGLSVQSE